MHNSINIPSKIKLTYIFPVNGCSQNLVFIVDREEENEDLSYIIRKARLFYIEKVEDLFSFKEDIKEGDILAIYNPDEFFSCIGKLIKKFIPSIDRYYEKNLYKRYNCIELETFPQRYKGKVDEVYLSHLLYEVKDSIKALSNVDNNLLKNAIKYIYLSKKLDDSNNGYRKLLATKLERPKMILF